MTYRDEGLGGYRLAWSHSKEGEGKHEQNWQDAEQLVREAGRLPPSLLPLLMLPWKTPSEIEYMGVPAYDKPLEQNEKQTWSYAVQRDLSGFKRDPPSWLSMLVQLRYRWYQ